MKLKLFKTIFALLPLFGLPSCSSSFKKTNSINYDIMPLLAEEEALDYSKEENWVYKQTDGNHEVDLLFFYPTVTVSCNFYALSRPNEEMKESTLYAFKETASCFAPYTNVYIPCYTQLPSYFSVEEAKEYFLKYKINPSILKGSYIDILSATHVRTDVYAALDYYFEHYNKGKPFMLAGHSQGGAVCQLILAEYMRVHPEYNSRMVATYSGGFSVSKEFLKKNPNIKYANGETDTGVIISWATEGVGATEYGFALPEDAICINPLNWKKDGTPANSSLNKGMLVQQHWLHCWGIDYENLPDATINEARGTIVTTINDPRFKYESNTALAGEKSYHTYDYAFYYMNLRENGKKRIESYLGKEI